MKRWSTKPLGEIAQVAAGDPAPQRAEDFSEDGIPFVRMQDVGRFGQTTCLAETKDRLSKSASQKLKRFPTGSILVPKSGASIRLNHRAILGTEAHVVSHLAVIVPKPLLNTRFVYYWLCGTDLSGVAHQADLPSMKTSDLAKLPVPVPPLAEQERIVKLLDEADELRKLRAQADRRIAALIPAIFHEMFGDVEQNTRKWLTKAVAEVCDLVRGSSPRPKSDPRYYGGPIPRLMIEDITRDGWSVTPRVDSLTELGATMSRPVKAGTIVMAVSGNIGLCAQLAVDACVHDGFVAFKDLHSDLFVPQFFGMAMGQMRQSHERSQAGAIFQNITTTDVKAMRIPVPPLPLQKIFADRMKEIRELEARQITSHTRLDTLFQSLLHRAFNGEL